MARRTDSARTEKRLALVLIAVAIMALLSGLALSIPDTLTIQGKLTSLTGTPQTGTFNMTFRIYDVYTGGNVLYTAVNQSVSLDSNGVYDTILEGLSSLNFSNQYYLGIEVMSDGESEPRINLTSSPYSFRANVSEDLNPENVYTVSSLTVISNLSIGTGNESTLIVNTSNINITGAGSLEIIGNISLADRISFRFGQAIDSIASGFLRVTGGLNVTQNLIASGNVSLGSSGNNTLTITTGRLNISSGNIASSGTLGISGTGISYIIGDLGIGTTLPTEKLVVAGNLNVTGIIYQRGSPVQLASTAYKTENLTIDYPNLDLNLLDDWNFANNGSLKLDNSTIIRSSNLRNALSNGTNANFNRLTLGTPLRPGNLSGVVNTTTQFGGEVSGAYNSIVISDTALDDQYVLRENASIVQAGNISFVTGAAGWTDDGTSVRLTTATDSVGIGTASPYNALTVVGSVGVSGSINATSINATRLIINNTLFVNGSRVGIGTSSPGGPLHLFSGSSAVTANANADDLIIEGSGISGISIITPNTEAGRLAFGDPEDDDYFLISGSHGDGTFRFYAGTIEQFRLTSSGAYFNPEANPAPDFRVDGDDSTTAMIFVDASANSLGIKTTTPQYALDVDGNTSIDGSTFIVDDVGNRVGIGTTSPQYLLQVASGTDGRSVNLSNVLYVNGSSGNVGIGTAEPSAPLEINSSSNDVLEVSSSDDHARIAINALGATNIASLKLRSGGTDRFTIGINENAGNSENDLHIYGGAGLSDLMTIQSSGSVGINTTEPQYALQVKGGVNLSNAVYVKNNGNVGIGTSAPQSTLEIWGTGGENTNPLTIRNSAASEDEILLVEVQNGAGRLILRDSSNNNNVDIRADTSETVFNEVGAAQNFRVESDNDDHNFLASGALDMVAVGTNVPNAKLTVENTTGDLLNILHGSTSRMFIGGSGNVGIGTASPAKKLVVIGSVNISNALNVSGTLQAARFVGDGSLLTGVTGAVTAGSKGNFSDLNVSKRLVANGILYVNGSRVGIGTSSPGSSLQIEDVNSPLTAIRTTVGGTTGSSGAIHAAYRSGAVITDGFGPVLTFDIAGGGAAPAEIAGIGGLRSGADTTGDLVFFTNAARNERMRILTGGSVGIGNTIPNATLEVSGTGNFSGTLQAMRFVGDGSLLTGITADSIGAGANGNFTYLNVSKTAIFANGNVGIGQTKPSSKLEVRGTMNVTNGATFFKMDSTGNVVIHLE